MQGNSLLLSATDLGDMKKLIPKQHESTLLRQLETAKCCQSSHRVTHSETKELKESWTDGESWIRRDRKGPYWVQKKTLMSEDSEFRWWSESKDLSSILLSEQGGGVGKYGKRTEHSLECENLETGQRGKGG